MLEAADGSSAAGPVGAMLASVAAKNTSSGGYATVRVPLGLILIVAAVLKGYELATEPVVGEGLFASRGFLIGLVELEWLFGVWMLAGFHPKPTWLAAVALFDAFACVSLYKGLTGEASCGCFGRVPVSPWFTLALDVGAVVALLRWRPSTRATDGAGHPVEAVRFFASRPAVVLCAALLMAIPAGLAMAGYHPAALSDDGAILGDSRFVILEPQEWVGKRFPLLEYIDIGEELSHGKWLVVLYHHDCPRCQEAIPRYAAFAQRWGVGPDAWRLAVVELPPFGGSLSGFGSLRYVSGRLSRQQEWFASTPVEIMVEEGYVLKREF